MRIVAAGCRGFFRSGPEAGLAPRATKNQRDVYMQKNNTSLITRPITIRVKNEAAAFYEGKPLNRMIESLMRYMEIGQIGEEEGELIVKGAFMVDAKIVADLKIMGMMYDMTFDDLFRELHRAIDEGEIDIEDGHFVYKGTPQS